jgi:hypothetical protein
MNRFVGLEDSHLGHSRAATPQWATSLASGSRDVAATDAFRLGRLYRRCTNGGDGIRAFMYFVNAYRR